MPTVRKHSRRPTGRRISHHHLRFRFCDFKLVALRDGPLPWNRPVCDTAERIATYWHTFVATSPHFRPDVENAVVILLNSRHRVLGHLLLSQGTLNAVLVHPRDVFRAAVVANASAVILAHNHPSGFTSPSESDLITTAELRRAGDLMNIDFLDHVIIGDRRASKRSGQRFTSLRRYVWPDRSTAPTRKRGSADQRARPLFSFRPMQTENWDTLSVSFSTVELAAIDRLLALVEPAEARKPETVVYMLTACALANWDQFAKLLRFDAHYSKAEGFDSLSAFVQKRIKSRFFGQVWKGVAL
jgi:hypothetical protein